jgi:hypothetical protein
MELKDYSKHGCGTRHFPQMKEQANLALELQKMLFDTYLVLDHGSHDERLAMLSALEKHFEETPPINERTKT